MTALSFHSGANVPVEVYDRDLELIDRTLSFEGLTLDPGLYFVQAHLPDGGQVRRSVEVKDEPVSVELEPDLSEVYVAGPEDEAELLTVAPYPDVEPEVPFEHAGRAVPFIGYHRGRDGPWTEAHRGFVDAEPDVPLEMPGGFDAVAIERPDGLLSVIRVPDAWMGAFRFYVQADANGEPVALAARLANPATDALLAYLNRDMLADAKLLVDSPELTAERLLRAKREDPIAAAAGAFALLRLNEVERLHDWTRNLANRFEWLPDGLVAWAEHLARLGKHKKAVGLLRRLPERGLPALSIGLAYANDRLRTYSAHWPEDDELRATLEELTRYSVATDFAAPVTTFSGRGPDAPEAPLRDGLGAET